MLLLPVVNEHIIEEKFEMNQKGLFWSNSLTASRVKTFFDKRSPFKINRFLNDDTYNVDIFPNALRNKDTIYETPYINANNEYEFMGITSSINTRFKTISSQDTGWTVHHSMLKDLKFHKTSVLALGTDVASTGIANDVSYPWYRDVFYPKFSYLKRQDSIGYNEVIHFRTIKSIEGEQIHKANMNTFYADGREPIRFSNPDFKLKYIYNDVYIKPIKPKLGSTDKRIAQVFIKNTDDSSTAYDYNITNGVLHSSSLGNSGLETYFEESNDSIYYRDAKLLGYISVANQTYYDYDAGKTKEGFSAYSKEGDTVPYNYKGDFTRAITFGINGVFDKVTLAFSEKITTPLLDPFEGITKLHITYNDDPLEEIPQRFLDADAIKKIREHNFSLVGINRISQIYAN